MYTTAYPSCWGVLKTGRFIFTLYEPKSANTVSVLFIGGIYCTVHWSVEGVGDTIYFEPSQNGWEGGRIRVLSHIKRGLMG